jgi:hypothetical protein
MNGMISSQYPPQGGETDKEVLARLKRAADAWEEFDRSGKSKKPLVHPEHYMFAVGLNDVVPPEYYERLLEQCFVDAAALGSQATLLHDEAIAGGANPSLAAHLEDHAKALTKLRDQLHDLHLTSDL